MPGCCCVDDEHERRFLLKSARAVRVNESYRFRQRNGVDMESVANEDIWYPQLNLCEDWKWKSNSILRTTSFTETR